MQSTSRLVLSPPQSAFTMRTENVLKGVDNSCHNDLTSLILSSSQEGIFLLYSTLTYRYIDQEEVALEPMAEDSYFFNYLESSNKDSEDGDTHESINFYYY